MSAVWQMACDSHTQKLVLLALADNADDSGTCWPSVETIAQKCDLSRQGVLNQIESLEESGRLQVERKHRKCNRYTIALSQPSVVNAIDPTPLSQPRRVNRVDPIESTPLTQLVNAVDSNHQEPPFEPSLPLVCEPTLPPEAEMWNRICGDTQPKVLEVGPKRRTQLNQRRRDKFWVEHFEEACRSLLRIPFYTGHNDRGWRADFDYMLRPGTVTKIIEGTQGGWKKPEQERKPAC